MNVGPVNYGFAPRLSRVAAGVCLLLLFGTLQYFLGPRLLYGLIFLPLLLAVLVEIVLPNRSMKKRIVDQILRWYEGFDRFVEGLDDRFESFGNRIRRQ